MSNTNSESDCKCCAAPRLIFACSGAADVGHISDLAARKLTADGAGKMFCLAGIGGRVSGIVASTQSARSILAIDGCPLDCARKTLEEAGLDRFKHLRLTDMNLEKGKTPVTEEIVTEVVRQAKALWVDQD